MKVWIVSKIHIGRNDCWVHGLTETKQNIRLLKSDGSCPSINTKFEIGQIWDLDFQKPSQFTLLYGENVIVHSWKYIGYERNLRDFLMERINPWYGGPIQLFGGYLCSGSSWKGLYVAMRKDLPSVSMGDWYPIAEKMIEALTIDTVNDKLEVQIIPQYPELDIIDYLAD